ncbi:MAG: hypothetical protein AAF191_05520, partial [Verrucomicrobiota bacterium]
VKKVRIRKRLASQFTWPKGKRAIIQKYLGRLKEMGCRGARKISKNPLSRPSSTENWCRR